MIRLRNKLVVVPYVQFNHFSLRNVERLCQNQGFPDLRRLETGIATCCKSRAQTFGTGTAPSTRAFCGPRVLEVI